MLRTPWVPPVSSMMRRWISRTSSRVGYSTLGKGFQHRSSTLNDCFDTFCPFG